ncbi:hypothetical protein CsNV_097 [Callinectes sapidus nudivirus]|nr:hypothetical protein CsNV_097 [Callinectes sapidus nudivirus]
MTSVSTAMTMFPTYNPVNNKRVLKDHVNTNEGQVLEKLYGISQSLFSEDFITTLFKIYEIEEFNISNFYLLQELSKCDMFMEYLKNENPEKMKNFEKVFNIYFSALAHTKLNINATVFKNKICTLLKLNIKVPSYKSGITLKNIHANVSTTFKPIVENTITARCDITNVLRDSFQTSISSSRVEKFSFAPQNSNVIISGPVIKNTLNGALQLQSLLLDSSKAMGVSTRPYIENTYKKFEF